MPQFPSKQQLYDPVRAKWVQATPEELVRQKILHWMLAPSGGKYPPGVICVEKSLSLLSGDTKPFAASQQRCDIAIYLKNRRILAKSEDTGDPTKTDPLPPLCCALLIECKAATPSHHSHLQALNQLASYSRHLCPEILAIASSTQIYYRKCGPGPQQKYYEGLPSYQELLACLFYK